MTGSDGKSANAERVLELKVLGDPEFVGDLAKEWAGLQGVDTSPPREEPESTDLSLALGLVVSIIALIEFVALEGPLVPRLWNALKHNKPSEVVLKTPTNTVRLEWTGQLSEAAVRRALTQLLADES
ncbi:MAG TPA: hypothetical protein VK721_14090 [Solirubrobacteraceae bacterium]|jgi:hypothetical protein|nr:hypothetical protein [Solirubrobacteraceae bacterium]